MSIPKSLKSRFVNQKILLAACVANKIHGVAPRMFSRRYFKERHTVETYHDIAKYRLQNNA